MDILASARADDMDGILNLQMEHELSPVVGGQDLLALQALHIQEWASAFFDTASAFSSTFFKATPHKDKFLSLVARRQGALAAAADEAPSELFGIHLQETLQWIHWDSAKSYRGRLVKLDAKWRVVYTQPTEKQNLSEVAQGKLRFLIPNTGCKMKKATAIFREEMPKPMLRLRSCLTASRTLLLSSLTWLEKHV